MSSKGKSFGVNVSKTLTEAKASGRDGVLYIPEAETQGVMVFGGKEYYAMNKDMSDYVVGQVASVIQGKFKVSGSAQCTNYLNGSPFGNWTSVEYGMGGTVPTGNTPPLPAYPDHTQKCVVTYTVKYNDTKPDFTVTNTAFTLNTSYTANQIVVVTDGSPIEITAGSTTITPKIVDGSTARQYTMTIYYKDTLTTKSEIFDLAEVTFSATVSGVSCSGKVNINAVKPVKPVIHLAGSTLDNQAVVNKLKATGGFYTSPFTGNNVRIASLPGSITGTKDTYVHIISSSNKVPAYANSVGTAMAISPAGDLGDGTTAPESIKATITLANGETIDYYVYTFKVAETFNKK